MKKSDLIAALAAIPGDPEIVVQAGDVGFNPLAAIRLVNVQRLIERGTSDGDFATVEDLKFLQQCETYRLNPRPIVAEPPIEVIAVFRRG